jgi:hypothetical protein
MKIIAVFQGKAGHRIVDHLQRTAPKSWEVIKYDYIGTLPHIIDEPDDILPKDLPQGDLLLYLGQNRKLAELIPDIAHVCQVKGVVAAVENSAFLPVGLRNQLKLQLARKGVDAVFPAPLCALVPEESENQFIKAFAQNFGKPELKVLFDDDKVVRVNLIRGAPCGNTLFVAEKVSGAKQSELLELGRLSHRHHPCTAAANQDPEFQCSLMSRAAALVEQALTKAFTESCRTY